MVKMTMTIVRLINTIFFVEILRGLVTTARHLFVRSVTVQYPHTKPELAPRFRGVMSLLRYKDGSEKCVGCGLCEVACPSRVIKVVSAEPEGAPLKRYAKEYWFDLSRCVFCGFCVEACPVDALAMTPNYEYSTTDKRDLMLSKEKLLAFGDQYFPDQPPKPAFVGSCESEMYLLSAQQQGYPSKRETEAEGHSAEAEGIGTGQQAASQGSPQG